MAITTDWLIALGTIGLFLVAIVGIFQDRIHAWLKHPNLNLSIDVSDPSDCHKTTLKIVTPQGQIVTQADCYYFRMGIENSGNQRAEYVEIFAKKLLKQGLDGEFETVRSFLPMNLLWSYYKKPFLEAISPGMTKHCDLGKIIDPNMRSQFPEENKPSLNLPANNTVFSLEVVVRTFTLNHLIAPGTYRLILQIAAANANPTIDTLEIVLTGNWYPNEQDMFGRGIGIRKC
jgi:hypothetical protein